MRELESVKFDEDKKDVDDVQTSTEWPQHYVYVSFTDHTEKVGLVARVLGNLAIYKNTKVGLWCLTHTLTGLCLTLVDNAADAFTLGELLNNDVDVKDALENKTKEEVVAALPSWVAPWMGKCKLAKKLVDPQ